MSDSDPARAIAFFETCDDLDLLREVLRTIRPRAAAAVQRFERQGREVRPPRQLSAAAHPATRAEALAIVRTLQDFATLQAVSRAVGRRLEALMESSP
jgi:hypothetical protein